MRLARVPTWEVDLVAWADGVRGQPFEYGRTDCVSLARQATEAVWGWDPVPEVKYNNLRSATRWLAAQTVEEWILAAGGRLVPEGPAFAQAGDLLVGTDPEQEEVPAVAVSVGGKWVVTSVERGVEVGVPAPGAWLGMRLYRFPLEAADG